MAKQMYTLRDIPKYETIRAHAARYPEIDPASSAGCVLLLRVASDILAAIEDYLASHKFSQGRWTVMMILYRNPEQPLNPCDLAERAGVTRATMTGLLDGLEREELLARDTVPADRRMLQVRLTEKGMRALDAVMPGYFRLIRSLMDGLPEEEKQALIALLTKLGATALSKSVESPCGPPTLSPDTHTA
jgi:DNA-binding MarR family transcriptional regulator